MDMHFTFWYVPKDKPHFAASCIYALKKSEELKQYHGLKIDSCVWSILWQITSQ